MGQRGVFRVPKCLNIIRVSYFRCKSWFAGAGNEAMRLESPPARGVGVYEGATERSLLPLPLRIYSLPRLKLVFCAGLAGSRGTEYP